MFCLFCKMGFDRFKEVLGTGRVCVGVLVVLVVGDCWWIRGDRGSWQLAQWRLVCLA